MESHVALNSKTITLKLKILPCRLIDWNFGLKKMDCSKILECESCLSRHCIHAISRAGENFCVEKKSDLRNIWLSELHELSCGDPTIFGGVSDSAGTACGSCMSPWLLVFLMMAVFGVGVLVGRFFQPIRRYIIYRMYRGADRVRGGGLAREDCRESRTGEWVRTMCGWSRVSQDFVDRQDLGRVHGFQLDRMDVDHVPSDASTISVTPPRDDQVPPPPPRINPPQPARDSPSGPRVMGTLSGRVYEVPAPPSTTRRSSVTSIETAETTLDASFLDSSTSSQESVVAADNAPSAFSRLSAASLGIFSRLRSRPATFEFPQIFNSARRGEL